MDKKKKSKDKAAAEAELLTALGDFTKKENWDKFFTIRDNDDPFEWYAEWPQLKSLLLSLLLSIDDDVSAASSLQILIPGCGNSRLSEHLYDEGFKSITNIDFSKVVISDMLRKNVRSRPDMRWRVMDMTSMQFVDETFDAIIDKGGLDALMEPKIGPMLGTQYLSEVKRVLKSGGKFFCLTLAESHVLGLLFTKFRFGWKVNIQVIPHKPSNKPSFHTFLVVAQKENSTMVHQITSSVDQRSIDYNADQVRGLNEALDKENRAREDYFNGSDIVYSLEDLQLGAKGDLAEVSQGRRLRLILGDIGSSRFNYRAVLLDARQESGPFLYNCGIFLVPWVSHSSITWTISMKHSVKSIVVEIGSSGPGRSSWNLVEISIIFQTRAHEWLFSSEEGQWQVVESSKAARLIMVILDASHASASMDEIQKDLSPLVKPLATGEHENGAQIPFMMASDGIEHRKIVHQTSSTLTGSIIVEDVVYQNVEDRISYLLPDKELIFRRLIFQRSEGLVQSEALLSQGESSSETGRKKTCSSSKSKKRGNQRKNEGICLTLFFLTHLRLNGLERSSRLKIDHSFLASSYHAGIIAGFMLTSSYLERVALNGGMVKAVVLGLGAGLLPMFLHHYMPFFSIEVVELDPMVLDLAKSYFDLSEDKRLKVHIADGVQFVRALANPAAAEGAALSNGNGESCSNSNSYSSNGSCSVSGEVKADAKVDILIVDVDSSDSSSGMTCPAQDFVEVSFLLDVRQSLSEQGLFVVNLVSRSSAIKEMVVSRMKSVFAHLYCLQLEEDVNVVLFALHSEICIKEEGFPGAALRLEKLLNLKDWKRSQSILDSAEKIKCLTTTC
ncbi:Methyltransferase type 11 [Dillenia turbinata]|uniref:Methyltransferase type 11 n=1 Tax=Dillenia turbinata TaxID=194707 RepID=A0AAN8UCH7_9MAGN